MPAIDAAMRGLILKPSVAILIAGSNRSFHGRRPPSLCARSSIASTPGVPMLRPLARALGSGVVWLVSLTQRR